MKWICYSPELNVLIIVHGNYMDPETGASPVEWDWNQLVEAQIKSRKFFCDPLYHFKWEYIGKF